LFLFPATAAAQEETPPPFPRFYQDAGLFRRAMAKASGTASLKERVSGLTLPHHLAAADLMARGLASVRGKKYDRIIILSTDHYKRGKTHFSVPVRDFMTCLGTIRTDREGVAELLRNPLVSASNLFSHEHGVQALLPFIASMLPDTPVLPVTVGIYAKQGDWDSLAESLRPLLTGDTLLVQSTDFSHYLPWREAMAKDAETLRVIASGREELVLSLDQPAHLDSRAAQYLQMKLQRERYAAFPLVTANHNVCEFLPPDSQCGRNTTSYIVQVYSPDFPPLPEDLPRYAFGGDFFSGRYLDRHLDTEAKLASAAARILAHTHGRPLILNLEGQLMSQCPRPGARSTAKELQSMPEEAALGLLKRINTVAVFLANNHSRDFGTEWYARTRALLEGQGIAVIDQDRQHAFSEFTLAAFTDLEHNAAAPAPVPGEQSFMGLGDLPRDRPLFAFVHCGRNLMPGQGATARFLARQIGKAGAVLFIGTNPHRAGTLEADKDCVRVWSLGNFLSEQQRSGDDGAVLEVIFFPQGTWWARRKPIGNLYLELLEQESSINGSWDEAAPQGNASVECPR
jgi:poly-gamma-glutamate synthesis protein (capsule biosynthesis protein)